MQALIQILVDDDLTKKDECVDSAKAVPDARALS
jgi:hypothetical protein